LDDYIAADSPVGLVKVFVDELDLTALGFAGTVPEATGRPAYHPAALLKSHLYGDLNRAPSSRRLERESQCNIELIWLTGRLMPDVQALADFREDDGRASRRPVRSSWSCAAGRDLDCAPTSDAPAATRPGNRQPSRAGVIGRMDAARNSGTGRFRGH
jgi:hypothetical protein